MPSATDALRFFFYCAVACDCLRFVVMVNEYRINAKFLAQVTGMTATNLHDAQSGRRASSIHHRAIAGWRG